MMRWFAVLRLRLRSLFRGGAADRELDREVRSHIAQSIEQHLASGLTPEAARRAALLEFGSIAGVQEACRDTRRVALVEHVGRDLRYAARTLGKQPALLVAGSLSIGLGVGANLTIFSLANSLLLTPPSGFQTDRLVHIRTGNGSHVSYPGWRALDESGALAGIAGYSLQATVNWREGDRSVTVAPLVVTGNYFDVVGVPLQRGRGFTVGEAAAERDAPMVVVSDRFWRRRLGADPDVVGRALTFNNRPYTVIGVLADGTRSLPGYGVSPDVYLPLGPTLSPHLDNPRAAAVQLIGRLHDGQPVESARAAVAVAAQRFAELVADPEFRVITTFSPVGGLSQAKDFKEIGAFFLVLLVVSALVLAIACANVAGLLLARGTARRREMAMRVALGASRRRLVQQLLTEGFALALVGTLAGVVLTVVLAQLLVRVSLPLPLPLEIRLAFDYRLAAFAFVLVLLSTLLTALTPAWHSTRRTLVPAIRQEDPVYGPRRQSLRSLLVAGQVAVTALLLVAAIVFLRNLTMAESLDPGFETRQALVARVSFVEGRQGSLQAPAIEQISDRVGQVPGVDAVAYTEGIPLTLYSGARVGTSVTVEGLARAAHIEYHANHVGPGYFAAMGIRLLRGRDFERADRAGAPRVVIINQAFADRYFAERDPIGRHLAWEEREGAPVAEIVGIVANGKYRTLSEATTPAMYLPYGQARSMGRTVHVVARTASAPEATAAAVRDAILQVEPSAAVQVETMSSALAFAFLPSRIGALLFGSLGLLACGLAMVGLYGVVAFNVGRRTVEFGVRMALGASRGAITRMVLQQSAVLVLAGLAVGLSLTVMLVQPLAAFVVAGLRPHDPLHIAGAAALLLAVGLAATWAPLRRALRIQPATALRHD